MSRSKHTEVQVITALKRAEVCRMAEDVAREYRVSKRTIYAWKVMSGGAEKSEA